MVNPSAEHDGDVRGSQLLNELKALETEVHSVETRSNKQRMEALLDRDFTEFGRSGRVYSREDVVAEFGPASVLPTVHSEDFRMSVLGDGVAMLTYRSAHVDSSGTLSRWTLRTSVWVRGENGWRMRFHQGTPTQCPQSVSAINAGEI